jgi:hypothetical protein
MLPAAGKTTLLPVAARHSSQSGAMHETAPRAPPTTPPHPRQDAALEKMRLLALLGVAGRAAGGAVALSEVRAALDIPEEQVGGFLGEGGLWGVWRSFLGLGGLGGEGGWGLVYAGSPLVERGRLPGVQAAPDTPAAGPWLLPTPTLPHPYPHPNPTPTPSPPHPHPRCSPGSSRPSAASSSRAKLTRWAMFEGWVQG